MSEDSTTPKKDPQQQQGAESSERTPAAIKPQATPPSAAAAAADAPEGRRTRVQGAGTDTSAGPLKHGVKSSVAGATWVAICVVMVLLVCLLVFIVQNMQEVSLRLFAWNVSFPAGVGFLVAALIGAAIVFVIGSVRMVQLRRQITRNDSKS